MADAALLFSAFSFSFSFSFSFFLNVYFKKTVSPGWALQSVSVNSEKPIMLSCGRAFKANVLGNKLF
jgi:hypothetical protein